MNTPSSSVVAWESGRLTGRPATRFADFDRDQWLMAALLVLSVVVLAIFVAVLEQSVRRSELQHEEKQARAVAEAECETTQPAELRGHCLAMFNGGDTVASAQAVSGNDAAPVNAVYEQPQATRFSTASVAAMVGAQQ